VLRLEDECPHCGADAPSKLGRAVKVAAAVTAAAVLSNCGGIGPQPAYGVALMCTRDSDCAQSETCNTQTHQCVQKPDAGP
jgi:hypothetical protein